MARPEDFADLLGQELRLYGKEVTEKIKRSTLDHMDMLVEETKATANVGHRKRHYRSHIKSKVTRETANSLASTWYVDGNDYRLSHLLNDGHALRDGGRYEGTQFIDKAEDKIVKKYEKSVEDIIKNG